MRWLAGANRLIAWVLKALGGVVAFVGLYLGIFGWLNDGPAAGLGIIAVGGGFGAALVASGFCFHAVARAHDTGSPRRWWLQVLMPMAAFTLFGLAAELTSFVEDLLR